ncbi:unnamed protein product [Sphagnum troendelagicum]|uniref:TF-B3 domain-containing protein n=1 Tax=Sphagnum troendelagicum TaxID=128251 RepID=A0ABP0TLF6_9BRYO
MADEWDFQRVRRFMDEQAAMPASSVLYMNATDLIRQIPAAPRRTCSTMEAEAAGTNSRLKAPVAAAVELQPIQQSPLGTSHMNALQAASGMHPSRNRSFEEPAADQSKLIIQQTVRAPTFTDLVAQVSSCVEEIQHEVHKLQQQVHILQQQDGAINPANHGLKRYKMSSSAEKLFNHQTLATAAVREADQAHAIPSERSGKAVYRKQLQQLQTDHEEPNLELRLGNGHLHNVDVQGTFLHSRAKELQRQRAAAGAAYPASCHIPVQVPRRSSNEFRYRVESRGGVLQLVASAFSRPTPAARPPIIGSTGTAMLPVSSGASLQVHPRLVEPNHGTAQLEALKADARAAAERSYRRQLIMARSASSSEMPIVSPPVPYTTTESYKGPPHQNCSPATTTISNATIMGHPASVIMGKMGPSPPPPSMLMRSMGPLPLPEILGPTIAQARQSVISTPFPPDRPLPFSPGDVSLCKYYGHFLLLELLQLSMSHPIPTAAPGLCIPLSLHVVMIQPRMIDFCVHDDDLLLLAAAAPPLHAGQEEEVANRTALGVQIPGRSRNAPALAAAAVVVGKVPDFWVTLTKFDVDRKFSVIVENHQQQEEVQLVLPEVISKHLPKEAVPLILRAKLAVHGHKYSASSSQSDVAAGAVAQHHELLDWPVVLRSTACTSSICDGWSQFVKDGKLEVGDCCRFHQNALDTSLFEVAITRPIKL